MLNLEFVEPTRKRKGSWSTGGHNGLLPIVRPRSRQRKSVAIGLLGRCVVTGYSLSRQGTQVMHKPGLRGRLGPAGDRNSRPRVTIEVFCHDRPRAGTETPMSRQGVLCRNKALWAIGRDHGQCRY